MSGLLPRSRWHLGKNWAWRRETERGKYSVCEKRREEGRKSDARKKRRRRRRVQRAAQKILTGARARSRAEALVVGTHNVRTLAFNGTNGIGNVEVTPPLRGSGTFWGSLRPEHHPGRGAAEGGEVH